MNAFKCMLITVIMVILIGLPVISQQEHKEIVEEVSVNWWQVPVFAVDKDGNPVLDLEPEDIEVVVNGKVIPTFTLEKRTFNVTQRSEETETAPAATTEKTDVLKKKVIFFLFDQATSSESSIRMAKNVAQKIINDAEENTRFIVMTIDSFAGLAYKGEGSGNNKAPLLQLIQKEVKEKYNKRLADLSELWTDPDMGGRHSKFEKDDIPVFKEQVAKFYTRKNRGFYSAFETLYFFLNSVEDHKFVYLFSEGMSRSIQQRGRSLAGAVGMDNFYLKRVANTLSRCGAVLFIINTMGVLQYSTAMVEVLDSSSPLSGENALHYLVKESGGTYMEGEPEKIVQRLNNMHHAYYEVSFPDSPDFKGSTREININAKRKGLSLHSLHSLEESKHYSDMKPVEKNMLVLNLVSMPDNALIRGKINAYNAQVEKTKKSKKNISYTVTLPPSCLYKHIDLYKVWLTVDDQGAGQLEKIEEEALYPKKNKLKIEFDLTADKKQKKEDKEDKKSEEGEIRAYFVLVNKDANPARASVYGSGYYQEDPELEELEEAKTAKKVKSGKTISPEEMNRILQGAADYCERIKQSAFHFYCQENIVETRLPLSDKDKENPYIDEEAMKKGVVRAMDEIRTKAYTNVKSYQFGYRLIKQGANIKEERDYISSSNEAEVDPNQVITTNAFFSQKAIFAPITILDSSRQGSYHYQFVDFDQYQGRPAVIIEATPKDPAKSIGVYGRLWIDTEDFSVMRIEADPQSIRGYNKLKDLAMKLQTKLYLSLESEFHALHNGIRMPTKVSMLEKYKGGQVISEFRGPKGWERTRTEFTYDDYQFFDVKTDVTVK